MVRHAFLCHATLRRETDSGHPSEARRRLLTCAPWSSRDRGTVRRAALEDPWTFEDWLWQLPPDGGQAQREVVLHLVHPEAFEPIVSRAVKRRIVEGFGAPASEGDVDRALHRLRAELTQVHGPGFSYIDPAVAATWRSTG